MWRNKKLLIILGICLVVIAGTFGGIAIANADDADSPPRQGQTALMEKVAEIYETNTGTAIDPVELQKAFQEAGRSFAGQMRDNFLDKWVENGQITQEQADQFKAWLESRPDVFSDEFKTWMESRPDIPGLFGGRFGGMMPFKGGNHGFPFGQRGCPPVDE